MPVKPTRTTVLNGDTGATLVVMVVIPAADSWSPMRTVASFSWSSDVSG